MHFPVQRLNEKYDSVLCLDQCAARIDHVGRRVQTVLPGGDPALQMARGGGPAILRRDGGALAYVNALFNFLEPRWQTGEVFIPAWALLLPRRR